MKKRCKENNPQGVLQKEKLNTEKCPSSAKFDELNEVIVCPYELQRMKSNLSTFVKDLQFHLSQFFSYEESRNVSLLFAY
jgi:hypothetical protein